MMFHGRKHHDWGVPNMLLCLGVIVPTWEHAMRVLVSRFCMHFAARRVVIEDTPYRMVDVEVLFSGAVAKAKQQQQQLEVEREMSWSQLQSS